MLYFDVPFSQSCYNFEWCVIYSFHLLKRFFGSNNCDNKGWNFSSLECKSFLDRQEKHAMYGFEKPFCQREVVGKKIKKEIIITTTLLHFFGLQATHTFLTLLVRKITCSISQNNQQFTAYIQSVSSKSIRITYQPNIHRQKKWKKLSSENLVIWKTLCKNSSIFGQKVWILIFL